MWPYPKHLKHFLPDDLVGDLGLEVEGLESLVLKDDSLGGYFEKDLFLFFQVVEVSKASSRTKDGRWIL